jgi:hypothetical protein
MDLWRVDDLIDIDPKTFFVLHTRRVGREIAHGIGIMAPAFSSYLGHKHFSFR